MHFVGLGNLTSMHLLPAILKVPSCSKSESSEIVFPVFRELNICGTHKLKAWRQEGAANGE